MGKSKARERRREKARQSQAEVVAKVAEEATVIRDSHGTVIPSEVVDGVVRMCEGAAGMAALRLLQSGKGMVFAGLQDNETEELTGLVLVTLDPVNTQRLMDFVKAQPGGYFDEQVS